MANKARVWLRRLAVMGACIALPLGSATAASARLDSSDADGSSVYWYCKGLQDAFDSAYDQLNSGMPYDENGIYGSFWKIGKAIKEFKGIAGGGSPETRRMRTVTTMWGRDGCQGRYGDIYQRSQWFGTSSEWAVRSFDASYVVAGDFAGNGATDVVAFAWGDETGWPGPLRYEMHMAAMPLVPPTDGSWGFQSHQLGDASLQEFRGWAAADQWPGNGVHVLAGNFDGNNKDDIVLVGGSGWTHMPVAFGGTYGWTVTAKPMSGGFLAKTDAAAPGKVAVGDFNGDGKDDVAAVTATSGIAVARSTSVAGDAATLGTFTEHTFNPGLQFMQSANDPAVELLSGDFNGDGKDDLLLFGKTCWASGSGCDADHLPVAFGSATGFTTGTLPSGSNGLNWFAGQVVAEPVVGDFNGDGRADVRVLALQDLTPDDDIDTGLLPWLFTETFTPSGAVAQVGNQIPAQLRQASFWPGAWLLGGNFNNLGSDDVAVVGRFNGGPDGQPRIAVLQTPNTTTGWHTPDAVETPVSGAASAPGWGAAPPNGWSSVTVPQVVGLSGGVAEGILNSAGLSTRVTNTTQCTAVPSGSATGSSPSGGTVVSAGSVVTLTVNTNPATCTVPNVVGSDVEAAGDYLRDRGFTIGTTTLAGLPPSCAYAGTVASTTPAAGSVVTYASTIAITYYSTPTRCVTQPEE